MDFSPHPEAALNHAFAHRVLVVYTGYLVWLGILHLHRLALDCAGKAGLPRPFRLLYSFSYSYLNRSRSGSKVCGKWHIESVDLYNTVSARFVAHNVSSAAQIKLPAGQAALIVSIPAGGKTGYNDGKMTVNGIVVDYRYQQK